MKQMEYGQLTSTSMMGQEAPVHVDVEHHPFVKDQSNLQSEVSADLLCCLPGVTPLSGPPLISLCIQPSLLVSRRARAVHLCHCSRCQPSVRPAPPLISLCIQPSSQSILGCRLPVSFNRVWWEPCPPTGSGALQLGRQGFGRRPRRAISPRT